MHPGHKLTGPKEEEEAVYLIMRKPSDSPRGNILVRLTGLNNSVFFVDLDFPDDGGDRH